MRDGDIVNAGDIVIRLDDTQTRANLAIVVKGLDELAARQAREEAERDGKDRVDFPADLLARRDDPEVGRMIRGEAELFEIRRKTREGLKAQLSERDRAVARKRSAASSRRSPPRTSRSSGSRRSWRASASCGRSNSFSSAA